MRIRATRADNGAEHLLLPAAVLIVIHWPPAREQSARTRMLLVLGRTAVRLDRADRYDAK